MITVFPLTRGLITISKKIELVLENFKRCDIIISKIIEIDNKDEISMLLKDTFKALADPVRRDILLTLRDHSLTVGEIVDQYNLSNSTISYHLSILKKVDLIIEKRYKNFIYYEINVSVFEDIMLWVTQFVGDDKNNEE